MLLETIAGSKTYGSILRCLGRSLVGSENGHGSTFVFRSLLHNASKRIQDNRDAEAFLKPVSKAEVPDYYDGMYLQSS